jgi:DNA helicase HerA-like ATPase
MRQGHWVLVNLSRGILREHSHTLGNLIFAKLQFDVFARSRIPMAARRLFSIICDEVQNLAENDLITLLTEGRKFGVGITTANQFWDQLPKTLRGALLAAGTQVFFRLSSADAGTLASELSVGGRQRMLRELTALSRGQAMVRVGAEAPQRMILAPPPASSRTRSAQVDALLALTVSRSMRSRTEIEHEIRRRHAVREQTTRVAEDNTHADTDEAQREW